MEYGHLFKLYTENKNMRTQKLDLTFLISKLITRKIKSRQNPVKNYLKKSNECNN